MGEVNQNVVLKVVKDPVPCQAHQKTFWNGKWDKEGMPKGPGVLKKMKQSVAEKTGNRIG